MPNAHFLVCGGISPRSHTCTGRIAYGLLHIQLTCFPEGALGDGRWSRFRLSFFRSAREHQSITCLWQCSMISLAQVLSMCSPNVWRTWFGCCTCQLAGGIWCDTLFTILIWMHTTGCLHAFLRFQITAVHSKHHHVSHLCTRLFHSSFANMSNIRCLALTMIGLTYSWLWL